MGVAGMPGRSVQRPSSRSGALTIRTVSPTSHPASRQAWVMDSTEPELWQFPSTAMTYSSVWAAAWAAIHSGINTWSGTRVLCRTMPVPGSWRDAWMKYRVSVHKPAWSRVMTSSPSPSYPLTQATWCQRGAMYSLPCGSLPEMTTAFQPRARIMSRIRSIRRS